MRYGQCPLRPYVNQVSLWINMVENLCCQTIFRKSLISILRKTYSAVSFYYYLVCEAIGTAATPGLCASLG
jgi:hypothetical protein